MCGIAGYITFSPEKLDSSYLQSMAKSILHRGPDETSYLETGNLHLAFNRLSIVDLENGHQPLSNDENSVFVVVNGEIYNHGEIREELESRHKFKTQSDSEALLHAYIEYGTDAFARLNGMFSAIIWDSREEKLILLRDRLGIKPLYYYLSNNELIFASELKAILMHPNSPSELNWNDLEILNLQQKKSVSTFVSDVHFLDAGSYATYSQSNGFRIEKYWDINRHFGNSQINSPEEFQEQYTALVKDSVQKRLMSDVPVGVFLSGGIDSSLIAYLAAEKNKNLHCFTVVERTTFRSGDVEQARKVTGDLGIPFYPIYFDQEKLINQFDLQCLEEMVYLVESPRFDPEWYFKNELHRAAKNYVPDIKVILLGQGADEFAGGYSTYLGCPYKSWEEYIAGEVSQDVNFYSNYEHGIPERLTASIKENKVDNLAPYHNKMNLLTYQLQYFNLWHEDRTSSYHSIESRVPFLDHRIVELLASVPEKFQKELFWNKKIVRDALQSVASDYPKDKLKVPFFATDDTHSINEFVRVVCCNIYEDFSAKYLSVGSILNKTTCDDLFGDIKSRRHNQFESSWRLIELMTIAIFDSYIKNPEESLERSFHVKRPTLSLIKEEQWDELAREYATTPSTTINTRSLITVPKNCEILNPLTEEEGSTCLVLSDNGNQVRRITISDQHYWLVQVLDAIGSDINHPKSIEHWNQKVGVPEEQFVGILGQLIEGGFLEKIEDLA